MIEPPVDPYIGPGADPDDEPPPDPLPPQDIVAEQAVLGAVMLSQAALDEVAGVLTPEDFYRVAHGQIWATVVALRSGGSPTDAMAVAGDLDRQGVLRRCGGAPYLHTLLQIPPTAVNVRYWAHIVTEKATLRRVAQAGMRIQHLAEDGARGADTGDVLAFVHREVELATVSRSGARMVPAYTAVWQLVESLDQPPTRVVPTPWPEVDDMLNGGLRPGELVYVAARPGVGKTIVGASLAKCAAQYNIPVAFWSLEMSQDEIMARLVADVGTVPLTDLIAHRLSGEDRDRAKRAAERIADWPLWIDDTVDTSIADLHAGARALAGQGVGLLVIDQLSLMTASNPRLGLREQMVGLSRDLKRIAKRLGCPVVVLHQLNRGPEQRLNKRPMLADLKETGSTEQDADKVLLLWRQEDRPAEITVIVAKHRNGPTGEVELDFHGRYARISSGDPYRNGMSSTR